MTAIPKGIGTLAPFSLGDGYVIIYNEKMIGKTITQGELHVIICTLPAYGLPGAAALGGSPLFPSAQL
jgi:hypothetical protein